MIHAQTDECRWEGLAVQAYKNDGTTSFKQITKQVLFAEPELACQLRYFEVQPGGYSTLERHAHVHAVMVVRGQGRVLVGDQVSPIHMHDLVYVPPLTWHQFQPDGNEALGFLCLVNVERDRPQLPDAEDLVKLRSMPEVADFIRV